MMTQEAAAAEAPASQGIVLQFPQVAEVTADQWALAALLLGSLGTLVALRKGMKGIGPLELTGSTIAAVEFAAMLMLIGTAVRQVQIYTADKPIGRALAFVY